MDFRPQKMIFWCKKVFFHDEKVKIAIENEPKFCVFLMQKFIFPTQKSKNCDQKMNFPCQKSKNLERNRIKISSFSDLNFTFSDAKIQFSEWKITFSWAKTQNLSIKTERFRTLLESKFLTFRYKKQKVLRQKQFFPWQKHKIRDQSRSKMRGFPAPKIHISDPKMIFSITKISFLVQKTTRFDVRNRSVWVAEELEKRKVLERKLCFWGGMLK